MVHILGFYRYQVDVLLCGRADEAIFFLGYPEDYDAGKFDVPEISKRIKGYTPNNEGVKAGFDAVGGRMTFAVGRCFLLPGVPWPFAAR